MTADDILTTRQAAALLQIGEKQLRRLCAVNRLRHVKIDGRGTIRTSRKWVADYLERASRPTVSK
jgi:excisionase family DNA binding protein